MMETISDVMDRLERARQSEVFDGDAHGYLEAVYQGRLPPDYARMKAASIAIEYERPTLKATAIIQGGDIAERLERAIERSNGGRLTGPTIIEAQPESHPPSELSPHRTSADGRAPFIPRRRI
jgi:hypothetical protein